MGFVIQYINNILLYYTMSKDSTTSSINVLTYYTFLSKNPHNANIESIYNVVKSTYEYLPFIIASLIFIHNYITNPLPDQGDLPAVFNEIVEIYSALIRDEKNNTLERSFIFFS